MATIIEKEVLIERTVLVLGFISRQSDELQKEMKSIEDEMINLRHDLYMSHENEIDYEEISKRLDFLKKKYQMHIYQ